MTCNRGVGKPTFAWVAAAALIIAACRTAPPATNADPMALRGIDFRADVEVEADSPSRILGSITIHNRRSTSALLTFPVACYGLLRAYEESARMAAVWEQPADACPEESVRLSLMPGEERTLPLADVDVATVLGGGLSPGSYRFTVVTAPDGHILEIEAGEEELER